MRCDTCTAEGERSTVTPDSFSTTTCMAYTHGHYDADGEWVEHPDPNSTSQGFWCSRNHRLYVSTQGGKTSAQSLDADATRNAQLKTSAGGAPPEERA